MGLFSRLALALLAVWTVVLGLLLLGLWRANTCSTEDCSADFIGWAILLGLWGWAGFVLIPAGIIGTAFLVYRRFRRGALSD